MTKTPKLIIAIPCYNEQKVLPISYNLIKQKLEELIASDRISPQSEILFINDGSSDNTWQLIQKFAAEDLNTNGINLSRNRGHQNALLAGMMTAKDNCDILISMDCDGQDDINTIDKMIYEYTENNCEIVYGVRNNRDTDTTFKRTTALSFYKIINKMGAECVYNHADYRLMSNRALNALSDYKEVNLFLRGIIPLIGFKSTSVYYSRKMRMAGETHYPLKKMINFAIDGITSLSIKPIRIIAVFGVIFAICSFIALITLICLKFIYDSLIDIWLIISTICLTGGMQLTAIGIIGEYIGKTYMETKARPRYIISETTYNTKQ